MITDDRAEKACAYIRDHSDRIGELTGLVKVFDHKIKVMRAVAFSEASGTVAERESAGYLQPEVKEAIAEYQNHVAELETIRTKIKAAELTFECWRTQNANARRGV